MKMKQKIVMVLARGIFVFKGIFVPQRYLSLCLVRCCLWPAWVGDSVMMCTFLPFWELTLWKHHPLIDAHKHEHIG